jgi:AraC-like DNA-binding protein
MVENLFFSLPGPLDALPSVGQMRAANLGGFQTLVRRLGGDPRLILERHGIDPCAISDSDYHIDCMSMGDVFEYCGRYFDDSLFALRLAQLQEPDVYGCVTALCRAAPTFGEALRRFIDYIPVIHSPTAMMELVEGKETTELRWSSDRAFFQREDPQGHYQAALLNLKLFREIGGRGFVPSYVSLTGEARLQDVAEIEKSFGCPFRRNATSNAIAFRTSVLTQPVVNSSRQLFKLLDGYLNRVKTTAKRSITERVEDYIRGALQSGNCSIERCAEKMGVASRTLQSRLSDRGLRFSEILETQRTGLARSYLQRPDLSLDEVAFLLGYAEQASFGRAFKRWTGLTPQGYRKSAH